MISRSVGIDQLGRSAVLYAVKGVIAPLLAVGDPGDKETERQGDQEKVRRYDFKTV
jgi:hypothetical protein